MTITELTTERLLLRGWRDTLANAGIPAHDAPRGDWSPSSGFRIGRDLLSHGAPTAVFCANDQMALGLLHAADAAGLRVPGDLSIVGFDDIPEAAHFTPPLTTMNQDFIALGRDAMTAVLSELHDAASATSVDATVPRLVERASTAGPRRP